MHLRAEGEAPTPTSPVLFEALLDRQQKEVAKIMGETEEQLTLEIVSLARAHGSLAGRRGRRPRRLPHGSTGRGRRTQYPKTKSTWCDNVWQRYAENLKTYVEKA